MLALAGWLVVGCSSASENQSVGDRIAGNVDVGASVQAVGADSLSGRAVEFDNGVLAYPDLTYAVVTGFRPLKLDLFLPPDGDTASELRPVVVYVHGGGWAWGGPRRSGAYSDWPQVLAAIASEGYVVASVGYRFSLESPFPAAIHDVKSSLQWLRANAGHYRIDPSRFAIWGQSAGGHLAALAATSCGAEALQPPADSLAAPVNPEAEALRAEGASSQDLSSCVQAVAGWYGVYDFKTQLEHYERPTAGFAAPLAFLGCEDAPCKDAAYRDASPLSYIDPSDPATLLIHGTDDTVVPASQSQRFYDALLANDVAASLTLIPDVGHSWIGANAATTGAVSREALQLTIDFFASTIGDPAGAD